MPELKERERTTLQEAGIGPKQSVPNFLLSGWWHTSPASPHTSHQPSTRPHSLLVCVVKSSQYSSLESVNSSVPCLLPLPKGCQVCCPLPQRVNLPACLTRSPGKWRHTSSPEEVCWKTPLLLSQSGLPGAGWDLCQDTLSDIKKDLTIDCMEKERVQLKVTLRFLA